MRIDELFVVPVPMAVAVQFRWRFKINWCFDDKSVSLAILAVSNNLEAGKQWY